MQSKQNHNTTNALSTLTIKSIYLMFGSPNSDETSYSSYVTKQQEILTKAYSKVRENTKRKQHRQKEFYNRRVHGKPYNADKKNSTTVGYMGNHTKREN